MIVGVTELCVAYGVNPGYLLFASFCRAELLTVPPDEHRKSNLRLVILVDKPLAFMGRDYLIMVG